MQSWMVHILGLDCSISIKDMDGHTTRFLAELFHLFPEFRAHALSINIPSQTGGDSHAIASAFSDNVFYPLDAHFLIGQKQPNIYRSCRVTGGGILVLFNVLFAIQIFALIFPPPFFVLGVIKSVVFEAIICRVMTFEVRYWP